MSAAEKGVLEAAMKLDAKEREELIEEPSASLDATDLGEYWEAEIKRRIDVAVRKKSDEILEAPER